jgi:adenosine deaminase
MARPSAALFAIALLASCAAPPESSPGSSPGGGAQRTAQYFEAIRAAPPLAAAFLRRMPKGADLHNHLSGAIYAESYIAWAAADGLCIDRAALALAPPPCTAKDLVPAAAATRDGTLYAALVDALSMRGFVAGAQSGHDHFFATFAKFGPATTNRAGDMLAEAAGRAGEENILYLELMTSPGMAAARKLGAKAGWDDDLGRLRQKLLAAGIGDAVAQARREIDAAEAGMRQRLQCDGPAPDAGCAVVIRYLAQVTRVVPREQVFAQFLLGFELARVDPRVVGLNLVAPEDDQVALRDYRAQMRMLGFLQASSPETKVSLHAGELTLGLVPPEELRFHIREAVETAGARRIGHGVDVLDEDDPWGLLAEMAKRHVLVEINLTSNDVILGVSGDRHPFMTYRRFGVPLALSTDDEGVSRSDLTHEYLRAALTYRLTYAELKDLARNSLEYAFLRGDSLWRSRDAFAPVEACAGAAPGDTEPPPACRDFLAGSDKAQAQWRLEAQFAAFEAQPPEQR